MPDSKNPRINLLDHPIVFAEPEYLAQSAWMEHIPLGMLLVDLLRPRVFVELGTHYGVSYCAFCQAVQQLNLDTKCYAVDTWKGDPHSGQGDAYGKDVLTTLRKHHDRRYARFSTLIQKTFDEALQYFEAGSIDLLHIDGYHTYDAVKTDFETWLPKMSATGVMILHDINEYRADFGAWKLWHEIKDAYPAIEILHEHGLGIVAVGAEAADKFGNLFGIPSSDRTALSAALYQLGKRIRKTYIEETLQQEIKALEQRIADQKSLVAQLQDNLQTSQQQLEQIQEKAPIDRQQLQDQISQQKATIAGQAAQIGELQSRLQSSQQQLEQAQQMAQDRERELLSQISAYASIIESLESQLSNNTATIKKLEARLSENAKRLRLKLDEQTTTIKALSAKITDSLATKLSRGNIWQRISRRFKLHYLKKLITWTVTLQLHHQLRRYLRQRRHIRLIAQSGLLATEWYLEQNPDVADAGLDPKRHYLLYGASEGRDPNPLFDTDWYLEQNPDVAKFGMNPLLHYMRFGAREGRDPSPLFDTDWYLEQNPDVLQASVNPLTHYIKYGQDENRLATPVYSKDILEKQEHGEYRMKIADEGLLDSAKSPHFESNRPHEVKNPVVKLIAFYLPQFHPTDVNNKFWGKGFTEWTNVTRAYPLFEGHYQPRLPGELGFYDLRIVDNLKEQARLARSHNITGFCIYRYWFNGKTVLDTPLELLYENKDIDIEYCLCWANENWTRRWDGFDHDILIPQEHSAADDIQFIADAERFFRDSRYIRVDNKPILIIYNVGLMPDPAATARRWKNFCQERGYEGLYLVAVMTFDFDENPQNIGFDAVVQMPPHKHRAANFAGQYRFFTNFEGVIHDYEDFSSFYRDPKPVNYTRFLTATPAWDNTARRGKRAGIIVNSSPQKYQNWLHSAIERTIIDNTEDERLMFINAWNEWAEGAYLEPDRKYGYAYLNATSRALASFSETDIVFLGHDAARAGSQIVLLELIEWFAKHTNLRIKVVLQEGGVLLNQYRSIADTLVLSNLYANGFDDEQVALQIRDFCRSEVKLIYANTCVTGKVLSIFPYDCPIISHIHELKSSIQKYCQDSIDLVISHSNHFVAVSDPVAHLLQERYQVSKDDVSVVKAFITLNHGRSEQIRKENIVGDTNTQIVWGCGTVNWRKGFDIFVNVALQLEASGHKNFQFCWIGARGADFPDVDQYLHERNAAHIVTYLGEKTNPRPYFILGDLFFLSSREDPFPLVALEAAEHSLPIVCFSDTGGIPEFVGNDAGVVIRDLDEAAMAKQIGKLLRNRPLREQLGHKAREKLLQQFTRQSTAPRILSIIREVSSISPKVSVVVPAYNHAKYLRKRLDSIYRQTFQDFEVILLDDGSTDGSTQILEEYAERHVNTTLVLNEQNGGSTFSQWAKGLRLAQADLIWIAEDDDFSEPTFLEKTLPYFSDPAVKLVYCQSYAVDEDDNILFNYQQYTDDLSPNRWASFYIADAQYEVNFALAKKNTIPNASGVVFRKFDFEEWEANWGDSRLAGDWAFYLHAIHGGKIAFIPEPLNYHRRHSNTNIKRYEFDECRFIESARVQRTILELYDVDQSVHDLMRQGSLDNWKAVYPEQSEEDFDGDYQDILQQ